MSFKVDLYEASVQQEIPYGCSGILMKDNCRSRNGEPQRREDT
jgi:hypothetical protein